MNKPIIVVTEDSAFANQSIPVPHICDMMCSALTGMATQVVTNVRNTPQTEEFDPAQVEKDLFDAMNLSFSRCLELSFPELAGRPDITEEAIMEAENKIVSFRAAQVAKAEEAQEVDPIMEPQPTEE